MTLFYCFLIALTLSTQLFISKAEKFSRGPAKLKVDKKLFRYSTSPLETFECSSEDSYDTIKDLVSHEGTTWSDGFFVQLDTAFSPDEAALIYTALSELQEVLCIEIYIWPQDVKPTGDYALISKDYETGKCSSPVGRQGYGKQIIKLAPERCMQTHIIIHECLHALGLSHEQSREDRDDFVDIFWENIIESHQFNFKKSPYALTFDVPYDVTSVMHYPSFLFAKNSTQPTILKKNGDIIPRNIVISYGDIQKLNKMYNCTFK